jgi:hypothetical protein
MSSTGKIYGIEDVMLVSRYDFTRAGLGRRSSLSTSSTEIPMYGKYPCGRPRFATHALSSSAVHGTPGLFSRRTRPL